MRGGRPEVRRLRAAGLPRYDTVVKLMGKVTLITNVSQYMGPACTEEFAVEGAVLALHDRTEARAQPAFSVTLANGRAAMILAGDLILRPGDPLRQRRGLRARPMPRCRR